MKIKYLKAYNGIQPGTIVDEHRPKVVQQLTKRTLINPEKGLYDQTAVILEDQSQPTTEDIELAEADEAAKKAEADNLAELEALTAPSGKGTPATANKAITRASDSGGENK